jgi:hypothetical protein
MRNLLLNLIEFFERFIGARRQWNGDFAEIKSIHKLTVSGKSTHDNVSVWETTRVMYALERLILGSAAEKLN